MSKLSYDQKYCPVCETVVLLSSRRAFTLSGKCEKCGTLVELSKYRLSTPWESAKYVSWYNPATGEYDSND